MNKNQTAAFVQSQTALLNLRLEGMKAENHQRLVTDQAMAYREPDFTALEKEFDSVIGYNAVMQMFHDAE